MAEKLRLINDYSYTLLIITRNKRRTLLYCVVWFFYIGLIAVPGAAGGQFVGGIICKKWKLKVKGMLRLNVIVCIIALLLDAVVWVRCDLEDIAGVTIGYNQGYAIVFY